MNQTRSDQMGAAAAPSDAELLAAVTEMLRARWKSMGEALDRSDYPHPKGSTAWAWHNGYVSAMRDALKMIENREGKYPMTMPRVEPTEG